MVGGLSWGYVGLSWGQCGPILGLCWPILELCWPILGLSWPILGLCWPILRPMLAHLEAYLGPCWPIWSHQIRKMGKNAKSTKHRKTREFLALPTLHRQGRRPVSPTKRRETPSAMPRPGGPWPDFWADAHRRLRRITRPSISSQCGLERWLNEDCCFRNIFLRFFGTYLLEIMETVFFLGSKWVPESSCEGFFLKNCCQFQLVTSCNKAPLCKDFSV